MAVTVTVEQVAAAVGATSAADVERVRMARAAAVELVERYAPAAPAAVADEATVRTVGYLIHNAIGAAVERTTDQGATVRRLTTSGRSALRHSGALALLSPWKVRRAL